MTGQPDAMTIYIPVSVLCIIPIPILRWILVGAGAGVSGWFLYVLKPFLSGLLGRQPNYPATG